MFPSKYSKCSPSKYPITMGSGLSSNEPAQTRIISTYYLNKHDCNYLHYPGVYDSATNIAVDNDIYGLPRANHIIIVL